MGALNILGYGVSSPLLQGGLVQTVSISLQVLPIALNEGEDVPIKNKS